jgi:hypothetical protein
VVASFIAGAVASAVTNPMEVIVVHKQTRPQESVVKITRDMVKKEGVGHIMKAGIGARVYYTSIQSVLFFSLITTIGHLYNVDLSD